MHNAELYPDNATAPKTQAASVPAPNNSLTELLPHHLNLINSEWLTNFVKWKFSGNQARILHAVYRHTIGFLKREDDMNGSRLEQITGIRYDHANEIVRKLAAKNILILRKGFYGFWISINFKFNQWNQTNIEVKADNNDPKRLLPEKLRNKPDDSGYSLDDNPQTEPKQQYANNTNDSETAPLANTASDSDPIVQTVENTQIQTKAETKTNNKAQEVAISEEDLGKIEQNNKALITQQIHDLSKEILQSQKEYNQEVLTIIYEQIGDLGQQVTNSIQSVKEEVDQKITNINQQFEGLENLDEKIQRLEYVLELQLQSNQQTFAKMEKNHQAQLLDKTEIQKLIKQEVAQKQTISIILPLESDTDLNSYNHYIDSYDSEQNASEELAIYQDYSEQNHCENVDLTTNTAESKQDTESQAIDIEMETPVADFKLDYTLHFPPQFTADMHSNIHSICRRYQLDKSTAKILLDYTAQRRAHDPKEVYSPVGYFAELAMNIDNGDLDIEAIQAKLSPSLASLSESKGVVATAPKHDLSLYYIRLKELKMAYHKSKEQYSYYESYFSQVAEDNKITFDQAVKMEERQDIWANTVNNLNLTHRAITDYVDNSPV